MKRKLSALLLSIVCFASHAAVTGWGETALSLNPAIKIDTHCPPTLTVQAGNDPTDDVRHSLTYYLAVQQAKIPVELRVRRGWACLRIVAVGQPGDRLACAGRHLAAYPPRAAFREMMSKRSRRACGLDA